MKKQLYRAAAATVLGLSLTTGVVAADTGSISDTGNSSINKITSKMSTTTHVTNHNNVGLANINLQGASSGDAKSNGNTNGGSAKTGDATNKNTTTATVTVDNSMPAASSDTSVVDPSAGGGSISDTGNSSVNKIKTTVTNSTTVHNSNDIDVLNLNAQGAQSGDASSNGNTNGGSAQSGDASNTNTSTFVLSVSN
jgi:hypothetical protein